METLREFATWFENLIWSTPLLFLVLAAGLTFSIVTKVVQWRVLTHGLDCIRGRYDNPADTGHISHFQALSAALSATIGLGNIAGVAIAVQLGGPGAVFWMWVVGFFGMALKFAECTLSVMHRDVRDVPDPSAPALTEADAEAHTLEYKGEPPPEPGAREMGRGEVRGGPMWYIWKGIAEPMRRKGNPFWVVFGALSVVYAAVIAVASFGGGNIYQGWNVGSIMESNFGVSRMVTGSVLAIAVAMVIIGGIRRIGQVASKLVPFMCVVYVGGALVILGAHVTEIPELLSLIVSHAFSPAEAGGAFAGVGVWMAFVWGMKRAVFSNEAGQGSAAIAHAAARTEEPIREGVVAGMGPFIDTLIICTMTALVLLATGVWNRPPAGQVAEIHADHVVVALNGELSESEQASYAREMWDGANMFVYVEQPQAAEAVKLDLPLVGLGDEAADRLAQGGTINLNSTDLSEEQRARLVVGQTVHVGVPGGADLTRFAFDAVLPGFGRYMLTIAVCLFAFSTMISWSYYGEKGTEFLFGPGAILPYKFIFVVMIFMGVIQSEFAIVYNLSDALTGLTVFCNLPALLFMGPVLIRAARDYYRRLDSGQMPKYR